jgi:hypothetical protein
MEKLVEESRAGFSLPDRSNFWEYFPTKTCDPGQANQKLLCGLHSRKSSKILSFLNSGISRNSQISSKKKHKKLFALKSTHRALAQNPPPHWQPEEEKNRSAIINEI